MVSIPGAKKKNRKSEQTAQGIGQGPVRLFCTYTNALKLLKADDSAFGTKCVQGLDCLIAVAYEMTLISP